MWKLSSGRISIVAHIATWESGIFDYSVAFLSRVIRIILRKYLKVTKNFNSDVNHRITEHLFRAPFA